MGGFSRKPNSRSARNRRSTDSVAPPWLGLDLQIFGTSASRRCLSDGDNPEDKEIEIHERNGKNRSGNWRHRGRSFGSDVGGSEERACRVLGARHGREHSNESRASAIGG